MQLAIEPEAKPRRSAATGTGTRKAAKPRQASNVVTVDGKVARLRTIDAKRVAADADTFQFKSGGDAKGVTDRLRGVRQWDPLSSGKAIVWERGDGKLFIADGHQRLGLAHRLGADGQKIKLDAYVLRAKDGWTTADARIYAAVKNIRESSGQALDMAKVMRERPHLVNGSIPMADSKVRDAVHLSKLSPDAFRMVTSGVVQPGVAAAVGEMVPNASRHADMLKEVHGAKVATPQHARLYVSQALSAEQIREQSRSLFGNETTQRSLVRERAQVLDKAITRLKQDKKIFSMLEREAASISAVGNTLARDANRVAAQSAAHTASLIEKLATTKGPVSSLLDDAARSVAGGQKPAASMR